MNKGTFIAGIAAGMVMGAAVSMIICPTKEKQKMMKKGASKAFKTLGSVIDSILE